jgi:hypothetical protein
VLIVEKLRSNEVGWFPARGSYEEAVLTWYEQIEQSFRRRDLEAQRMVPEPSARRSAELQTEGAGAD